MYKYHHCLVPETPPASAPEISPFVSTQYFSSPSLPITPTAPALSQASSAFTRTFSKLVSAQPTVIFLKLQCSPVTLLLIILRTGPSLSAQQARPSLLAPPTWLSWPLRPQTLVPGTVCAQIHSFVMPLCPGTCCSAQAPLFLARLRLGSGVTSFRLSLASPGQPSSWCLHHCSPVT